MFLNCSSAFLGPAGAAADWARAAKIPVPAIAKSTSATTGAIKVCFFIMIFRVFRVIIIRLWYHLEIIASLEIYRLRLVAVYVLAGDFCHDEFRGQELVHARFFVGRDKQKHAPAAGPIAEQVGVGQ